MFLLAGALSEEEADVPTALTPCAYRSLDAVLCDVLVRQQERQTHEWGEREAARRVAARRIARVVAGATALLVGATALVCGLASFAASQIVSLSTWMLLSAWPLAFMAGVVARLAAGAAMARRMHAPVSLTGSSVADLIRLDGADTLGQARAMAARWERASTALPLAALSMTAPLTIHFGVWLLLAGPMPSRAGDFGAWIGMSALIVGHAHLALAGCAARWAFKLRDRETAALGTRVATSAFQALFVSVAVASVPGILLIGLPPALVLVTGILFVPAMYAATVSTLRRERLALAS
jgi:hypothetical protein